MSIAHEIAIRHFGRRVVKGLNRKGITFWGIQGAPAFPGDTTNSGIVYRISVAGEHQVRTHSEVVSLSEGEYIPERTLPFGKHKGKTLDSILNEDPGYIRWLADCTEFEIPAEIIIAAMKELMEPDSEGGQTRA